jgi:hypothetical protein
MSRALQRQASGGSGNLNTVTSGTTVGGTAVFPTSCVAGSVSCLFNVLAETNTLTITGKFQVSTDNSTWYDLAGDAQNPANVVLATGTAGTDTATTRVLPVPPSAARWPYLRAAVVVGGTTGAAADTYAFTFNYEPLGGF